MRGGWLSQNYELRLINAKPSLPWRRHALNPLLLYHEDACPSHGRDDSQHNDESAAPRAFPLIAPAVPAPLLFLAHSRAN